MKTSDKASNISALTPEIRAKLDAGTHFISKSTVLCNLDWNDEGNLISLGDESDEFYTQVQIKANARPLCGARCRSGKPCKARVLAKSDGSWAKRCRMHGGLSTGPKSSAGRAAIAESNRRRAKTRPL